MMLKYLIQTSIFRYFKNYGSLTHETRIKDAVNMGDLICLLATVRTLKGTNGRQKTSEIFHVYCIFYSGFRCQTTVIFGITKDGSLVLNTLAS